MNSLFKGVAFCIILMSMNVNARNISASWEGVITLLYQPSLFSTITTEDIQNKSELLINDGSKRMSINREYMIQQTEGHSRDKIMNTSVVVLMYRL